MQRIKEVWGEREINARYILSADIAGERVMHIYITYWPVESEPMHWVLELWDDEITLFTDNYNDIKSERIKVISQPWFFEYRKLLESINAIGVKKTIEEIFRTISQV